MEKVVVAISLSAIFKPKLKKIQTMTDQSDRILCIIMQMRCLIKVPFFLLLSNFYALIYRLLT